MKSIMEGSVVPVQESSDVKLILKTLKRGLRTGGDAAGIDEDEDDEEDEERRFSKSQAPDFNRLSIKDPGRFLHAALTQMCTYMRRYRAEDSSRDTLRLGEQESRRTADSKLAAGSCPLCRFTRNSSHLRLGLQCGGYQVTGCLHQSARLGAHRLDGSEPVQRESTSKVLRIRLPRLLADRAVQPNRLVKQVREIHCGGLISW